MPLSFFFCIFALTYIDKQLCCVACINFTFSLTVQIIYILFGCGLGSFSDIIRGLYNRYIRCIIDYVILFDMQHVNLSERHIWFLQ